MNKKIFLVLLATISSYVCFSQSDRVNLNSTPGMEKGTIFFMPETDVSFQSTALNTQTIKGMQFFTSWGTIEKTEGVYDWSKIDASIKAYRASGKKLALCIPTANFSINDSPEYLYNNYGLRRIVAGYWESFESATDKGYVFYGTKTTSNPITGTKSLQLITTTTKTVFETGANHVFDTSKGITNPTYNPNVIQNPNRPSAGFCLQFDYRANEATSFTARAFSKTNPTLQHYETTWTAASGEKGMKTFNFYPKSNDYKVEVRINNAGNLTVDNINICDMVTGYHIGTLCFPNYFNPIFLQKYEVFVKALADRYKNEDVINSINVGGYGRWEEITISADEPNMFEDQWTAFGFTNDKYIDHIKSCIDLYRKYFPNKRLYTGAVGWNMESWRDQNYIEWKIQPYAASKGVGIKKNGWQSTEWASAITGFSYNSHRYKYNPQMWVMYEEAGQINNTQSEYMGHPISLLNRSILDGADYNWLYSADLSQSYISKYFHYANESAGATLSTNMYTLFCRNDYFSPKANQTYVHRNIFKGIYQRDDFPGTKFNYVNVNGQKAVQTSSSQPKIQLSIDDRIRYHEMYGAVFALDYLDSGSDQLKISANSKFGQVQVALVRKRNSNTWKTISFIDNGWLSKSINSGVDDLAEIEIDDMGDGVETLKSFDINYVPANDFQEKLVAQNEPVTTNKRLINADYTFTLTPVFGEMISSIALNISPFTSTGYFNIEATITATVNGETKPVTVKEYFMPLENDWFNLPVANVPYATSYQITLKPKIGQFYLHLGADNMPAVRSYLYFTDESMPDEIDTSTDEIEALRPFTALNITNSVSGALTLHRKLPEGAFQLVGQLNATTGTVFHCPQPAGYYKLTDANQKIIKATPIYLKKLPVSNKAMRYSYGTKVKEFLADDALQVVSGMKQCTNDTQGFHARIISENPTFKSTQPINLSSRATDNVHFIMKNETASSLAKMYWRTSVSDFSEANSVLMPVVPNDDCYREYTYPIGLESTWRDDIMDVKFIPVTGHINAGKIHLHAFDIRRGTTNASKFADTLALSTTNFSVSFDNDISGIDRNTGNNSLQVYPNPFQNNLSVEIYNLKNESFHVSLVSTAGVVYFCRKQTGNFSMELDKSIPNGMYIIRIQSDNQLFHKLLIKNG